VPVKGSFVTLAFGAFLYVMPATGFGMLVSTVVRTQIAAIFAVAILTIYPSSEQLPYVVLGLVIFASLVALGRNSQRVRPGGVGSAYQRPGGRCVVRVYADHNRLRRAGASVTLPLEAAIQT
jgi:hypothetical protein